MSNFVLMHYLTFLKISTSVRQGFFEINKEVRIRDFMLNKMELRQNFINSYAFCTVSFRPKAFTTRLIVSKRGAES